LSIDYDIKSFPVLTVQFISELRLEVPKTMTDYLSRNSFGKWDVFHIEFVKCFCVHPCTVNASALGAVTGHI